jgi:hypothetical protein
MFVGQLANRFCIVCNTDFPIVPTLQRGNASVDAPASSSATLERCSTHSNAERWNDEKHPVITSISLKSCLAAVSKHKDASTCCESWL